METIDYLKNRMKHYPLLTHQQVKDLYVMIKKGNEFEKKQAKDLLVNSNIGLLIKIANGYKSHSFSINDFIQEGAIGLMKAIDRYDPDKGAVFSTYATNWIRQAISRAFLEKTAIIRLPCYMHELYYKAKKFIRLYHVQNAEEPTDECVAEHLNVCLARYQRLVLMMSRFAEIKSIDQPVSIPSNQENVPLVESIVFDSFEDELHQKMENEQVLSLLDDLSKKEKTVILHRFGLDGNEQMTLEQIGKILHLTRERVRQIEKKALLKLRNHPKTEQLKII